MKSRVGIRMNTGYIMIILAMLIWGSIGIVVKSIDQTPEVIVFSRVFVTFITIGLWVLFRNNRQGKKTTKRDKWLLPVSGLFLSLNWLFFFKAVKITSVASATLSYYTAPIIVTVLSVFLLQEKLTKKTVLAIAISFVGIVVMLFSPGSITEDINVIGILFGLVAAFFYSLVTISAKLLRKVYSYKIILIQTGISSMILLPALKDLRSLDVNDMALMLIIGVLHTSFALVLYFEGIKRVKVQHVGILSYLDPLGAVFFAFVILNETPKGHTLLGGILILMATYVVLNKKPIRGKSS